MGSSNGKYVLTDEDINWFSKNTMIGKQDIKTRYKEFVKSHPLGKIEKSEYINMIKECYGKNINYKGLEKYMFEVFDRNGDGWVDFKEFLKVIYILSNESPKEKLELLFRVFDTDQNGTISHYELKAIVKDFFHLLGKFKLKIGPTYTHILL